LRVVGFMANLSSEFIEIIVGVIMMILGFFSSLLMTIRVLQPDFILAFGSYGLSLAGFVIGAHGLYGIILVRRSKEPRETPQ